MAKPRVSACYIVKDEEEYLPFSIRSIHTAVDEVIVVDNGSTDRTVEVIRPFPKVRVFPSAATNFSEARNEALARARGDWLLLLDADEVFYDEIQRVLPRLVVNPKADAYTCWFYHLMGSYDQMQNRQDRDPFYHRIFLVRNRPGLHYEGAVHERLVGHGPRVLDSGLHYVHYGYCKPKAQILARWRRYAELEGRPHLYDGWDPERILDGRPVRPFPYEHPEAIRDYVRSRSARQAP